MDASEFVTDGAGEGGGVGDAGDAGDANCVGEHGMPCNISRPQEKVDLMSSICVRMTSASKSLHCGSSVALL